MTNAISLATLEHYRKLADNLKTKSALGWYKSELDHLSSFFLANADVILDVLIFKAKEVQCANCGGKGRHWVITDCDSGYWEKCKICDGTGAKVPE